MSTQSTALLHFIGNAFGDQVIYEINRDAFDRTGAAAVFQRHFGESLRHSDSLYLIIGTDSGLLAEWLLKQELPEGTRYLFIEPESVLPTLQQRLPQIEELPRVALTSPEHWQQFAESFQFREYAYLEKIRVVQSIGATDAYLTDYRRIHWDVQAAAKELGWQIEFQLGSQVFVRRQIENIAENRDAAICLQDLFAGKTAILLGGGPSLDELLPWVSEQREHVAVIAVSRICRRLLEAGLQPDIVVSIDPHNLSFDVSKEMLRFDENTLLIHSYHVSPLLLAQWQGPSVFFGERLPWRSKSNQPNLKNQGPTVTNTALAMAVELGFSTIVLGGVDLCYSREGHTHASGSNERNAGPLLGNVGVQVETNGGWQADTRHSFATAVNIMGKQAKSAGERGCRIINPAPGAAKIPHVEHCLPADIALPQEPLKAPTLIRQQLPDNNPENRLQHYHAMRKEIARANGRLRAIMQLADDALACNDGLFGRNGKTADFKYKKRMDKIERRLDREYKDISPLVKNYGSRAFLRLVRPDKERDWSDDDIEQWGRAYYEIYKDNAEQLLAQLEQASARLQSRIAEEHDTPDITHLAEQWRKDATPGRAQVWRAHHPMAAGLLDSPSQQALQQQLDAFEQVLQQTDTEQAKWCQANYTLEPVRSKLAILFQQRDREELQRTAEELGKNSSTQAQHLLALANGYLAELDEQPEQALMAYQPLLDYAVQQLEAQGELPVSREMEDALRRMSGITVAQQRHQEALMLLEALSGISAIYLPQYAELLKLTGDLQGAVDTYSSYLKRVPGDVSAALKLGQIFQLAGAAESASWAYQYVLQQDPDNQAAQTLLGSLASNA